MFGILGGFDLCVIGGIECLVEDIVCCFVRGFGFWGFYFKIGCLNICK